jgi:UDP-N-acetylglucosamine--N-acetylmuramyl-(pentapeptide) pyrophosphoryl-undecaprenol N-acetylglucosamine transferase
VDNAAFMAGHGAAIHLPQAELSPQSLAELIDSLDRGKLLALAERARLLARHGAASQVTDELDRLVAAK